MTSLALVLPRRRLTQGRARRGSGPRPRSSTAWPRPPISHLRVSPRKKERFGEARKFPPPSVETAVLPPHLHAHRAPLPYACDGDPEGQRTGGGGSGVGRPGEPRPGRLLGPAAASRPSVPGGRAPCGERGSEGNTQGPGKGSGSSCSQQKCARLSRALVTVDPVRLEEGRGGGGQFSARSPPGALAPSTFRRVLTWPRLCCLTLGRTHRAVSLLLVRQQRAADLRRPGRPAAGPLGEVIRGCPLPPGSQGSTVVFVGGFVLIY